MQSYSAGSSAFLSKDSIGQDAGEFVASWLTFVASPLREQIEACINDQTDIVSQICLPLLNDETTSFDISVDIETLKFTRSQLKGRSKSRHWRGFESAATTLGQHLETHPDKLFRLRLVVMLSSVIVMRHVASLETYYDKDKDEAPPFLLDFGVNGDLRDAAKQSYSRCTQSIARFYAFAFGQELKRTHSAEQLTKCTPPRYKEKKTSKVTAHGDTIWKLKKEAAKRSRNKFECYGEAVFDILSLYANANAISYFKNLGWRSGLIHPKSGAAVPWFRPKQVLVELLVYCCVEPGESLEISKLCERLWQRFGILVGGGQVDEEVLQANSIYSWDRDSLRENTIAFGQSLVDHGFATELADGVMKVSMEVVA
jgi:hypothetical protein